MCRVSCTKQQFRRKWVVSKAVEDVRTASDESGLKSNIDCNCGRIVSYGRVDVDSYVIAVVRYGRQEFGETVFACVCVRLFVCTCWFVSVSLCLRVCVCDRVGARQCVVRV